MIIASDKNTFLYIQIFYGLTDRPTDDAQNEINLS